MSNDGNPRPQTSDTCPPIAEAVKEKCQQLSDMRMRGECPENCEQEYVAVLQKIEELRSTDVNAMFDQMILANEYSKFFSREKCLQLVAQCQGF